MHDLQVFAYSLHAMQVYPHSCRISTALCVAIIDSVIKYKLYWLVKSSLNSKGAKVKEILANKDCEISVHQTHPLE